MEDDPLDLYLKPTNAAPLVPSVTAAPVSGDPLDIYLKPTSKTEKPKPPSVIPEAIRDIPTEIGTSYKGAFETGVNAINTIGETLNPFSASRRAGYAAQANAPSFVQGLGNEVAQLGQTGSGLAAIPKAGLAGITTLSPIPAAYGTAESLIGHGMASAEHALGNLINPTLAAKDNPAEMYSTAKSDVDTALSALTARYGGGKMPAPTKDQIYKAGSDAFDAARATGALLHPNVLSDFATQAISDLKAAGGYTNRTAPTTVGTLTDEIANRGNAPLTVDDLLGFRKQLKAGQKSNDPQEVAAATIAKHSFDDYISNLAPHQVLNNVSAQDLSGLLDTGRKNWAAAERMDTVDSKIARAQLRASAANSGMNASNLIRQRTADILLSRQSSAGWSPQAIDQATKVVEGTTTGNTARRIKNIFGGGGGLGTFVTGGVGAMMSGSPEGAALAVPGLAGHIVENISTANQINKLRTILANESPLAKTMGAPQMNPLFKLYGALPSLNATLGH